MNESDTGRIWKKKVDLAALNRFADGSMVSHVGIEYLEIGDDFIRARMPVDARTKQPFGLLHGGASLVLAETLGSTAAHLCVDEDRICVGIEINANHVRQAKSGHVVGTTRPLHTGGTIHVWETEIRDEEDRLVSVGRITLAVLDRQ